MSSEICLGLDQSKILSSGNELNMHYVNLSIHFGCAVAKGDLFYLAEASIHIIMELYNPCCLTYSHTMTPFDALKIYSCRKHCKKRRNCL